VARPRDRLSLHPLFDGYDAAENRGTLALAYTLDPRHSPGLLSSFASRFLDGGFPVRRGDRIVSHLQLSLAAADRGPKAIPDATFVNDARQQVLVIESKVVPRSLSVDQLRRHLVRVGRRFPGYQRTLLVVSPDPPAITDPVMHRLPREHNVSSYAVTWFRVHEWASEYVPTAAPNRQTVSTATFLAQQLVEFLRGRDWMGFQGFPADWPDEYRVGEAREHLKRLREYFRDHLERVECWPTDLMPTRKKLTEPWFPIGEKPVHLTVYARQDWTGVDLYVPGATARKRLKALEDWPTLLDKIRSLPDARRVWITASRWRLINPKQGRQTGPMMDTILLSVRATDLLDGPRAAKLAQALRRPALDADIKALAITYRYYFQDSQLRHQLRTRKFADVLIDAGAKLLDLYRWFGTL
jgi:hypothetical protein